MSSKSVKPPFTGSHLSKQPQGSPLTAGSCCARPCPRCRSGTPAGTPRCCSWPPRSASWPPGCAAEGQQGVRDVPSCPPCSPCRAGDNGDTQRLLPPRTGCLYQDHTNRSCSIPQWEVLLWVFCSSPSRKGLGDPSSWAWGHSEPSWMIGALTSRGLPSSGLAVGTARGWRDRRELHLS